MRVVIRIGGAVVASPPNPKLLNEYAEVLRELKREGHELVVVVGGGSIARELIGIAKNMGLEEEEQDEVAILATRLFAKLLNLKLKELTTGRTPTTIEEAQKMFENNHIVVMGGIQPGMTTDTVAALAAEKIKADLLIKATDQDGVYDKDPKKYPEAKKLEKLTFEELSDILEESRHKAGIRQIIDPKAIKILKKTRMKTIVVNGFNPRNILKAIRGEKIGTEIH